MIKVYKKFEKKEVLIDEKKDFLASGGEGSVYLKDNLCYKIMEHKTNETKLLELMELKKSNIITPIDLLLDRKNILIGYVSTFVDGDSLCRLFNTSFWKDNKIDTSIIGKLVDNMVSTTQYIHDKKYLIVDWNEMNYMVNSIFDTPYFIDTNAWKTPNFPPNAITPLFQDHSTKDFTTFTDWFGFGILICKLYTGIHPFKGSHPGYGRGQDDTIKRMKDKISIFNKDVRVPAATRDFSIIPDSYMNWFINIFEKGKREVPPNVAGFVTISKPGITTPVSYQQFQVDLFKIVDNEVQRYYCINNTNVIFCDKEILIGLQKFPIKNNTKIGVLISQRESNPYFVYISKNKLIIQDGSGEISNIDIFADDFIVQDHIIYIKNKGTITQITCVDVGEKQVFSVGDRCDVMPNSTKTFGNCFYMSVMGNAHFIVPWSDNKNYLKTVRVPELDGYKIVEAKFDKTVLGVIGEKNGKYDRFMLIIDPIDTKYLLNIETDISVTTINFVVLDNGIGVSMDEDGKVTIFTTNINKYQTRIIQDPAITKVLRLFKNKTTVLFAESNKIYSLKVKVK